MKTYPIEKVVPQKANLPKLPPPPLHQEEVLKLVLNYFEISKAQLYGKCRKGEYVLARQIYSYLLYVDCLWPYVEIGKELEQDRSSATYSVKMIHEDIKRKHPNAAILEAVRNGERKPKAKERKRRLFGRKLNEEIMKRIWYLTDEGKGVPYIAKHVGVHRDTVVKYQKMQATGHLEVMNRLTA